MTLWTIVNATAAAMRLKKTQKAHGSGWAPMTWPAPLVTRTVAVPSATRTALAQRHR